MVPFDDGGIDASLSELSDAYSETLKSQLAAEVVTA
jgi:hypothetical protein